MESILIIIIATVVIAAIVEGSKRPEVNTKLGQEVKNSLAYDIMVREIEQNGIEALVHILNRRFEETNKPHKMTFNGSELILNIDNPELGNLYRQSKRHTNRFYPGSNTNLTVYWPVGNELAVKLIEKLKSGCKSKIVHQNADDKRLYQIAGVSIFTTNLCGMHLISLKYPSGIEVPRKNYLTF